jgi:hypothetical protein
MTMKLSNPLRTGNTGRVVALCGLIILLPIGYSAVRALMLQGSEVPQVFLERPAAAFQDCVEETSYMRVHHMDLLKQLREDVIRDGIRGEVTLEQCARCHTSRERFCDRCHQAANVILDCFGCHYYPEPGSEAQGL